MTAVMPAVLSGMKNPDSIFPAYKQHRVQGYEKRDDEIRDRAEQPLIYGAANIKLRTGLSVLFVCRKQTDENLIISFISTQRVENSGFWNSFHTYKKQGVDYKKHTYKSYMNNT